jgi:Ni/Co efflux regulator RcnB
VHSAARVSTAAHVHSAATHVATPATHVSAATMTTAAAMTTTTTAMTTTTTAMTTTTTAMTTTTAAMTTTATKGHRRPEREGREQHSQFEYVRSHLNAPLKRVLASPKTLYEVGPIVVQITDL